MADEPEDLTEFIAGCLAKDPAQRFTPLDCMEVPFLTNPKRKSPEGMSEEVRFASDLTEFGEGSRDEFYYWLARKYATQAGMPLVRFNELYDSLTVKLSEWTCNSHREKQHLNLRVDDPGHQPFWFQFDNHDVDAGRQPFWLQFWHHVDDPGHQPFWFQFWRPWCRSGTSTFLTTMSTIRDINLFDSVLTPWCRCGTSTFLTPVLTTMSTIRDINLFDSSFDNHVDDPGHQPFWRPWCRCGTSTFLIPVLTTMPPTFLSLLLPSGSCKKIIRHDQNYVTAILGQMFCLCSCIHLCKKTHTMIKAINTMTTATIAWSRQQEKSLRTFGGLLVLVDISFTKQNKILQARKLLVEVCQDGSWLNGQIEHSPAIESVEDTIKTIIETIIVTQSERMIWYTVWQFIYKVATNFASQSRITKSDALEIDLGDKLAMTASKLPYCLWAWESSPRRSWECYHCNRCPTKCINRRKHLDSTRELSRLHSK